MLKSIRSVLGSVVSIARRHQTALIAACAVVVGISAAHADANVFNVITYDEATNAFTYSFTGLLKALVGVITAAMAAGCVLFILVASWRFAKKLVRA
jgi:hypothetical protein